MRWTSRRQDRRYGGRPVGRCAGLARCRIARAAIAIGVVWLAGQASGQPAMAQDVGQPPQPSVGRATGGGAWSAKLAPRPKGEPKAPAEAAAPAKDAKPLATAIRISGDDRRTRVRMDVTRQIVASLFTLEAPYRAIIDIPDLEFRMPPKAGASGRKGLVSAFRYGQFLAGRSRVVIDLGGPARIENAAFTPAAGKEPANLTFDLVAISAAEFAAIIGVRPPAEPPREEPAPSAAEAKLRAGRHDDVPVPSAPGQAAPKTRPVVVIDPGHGGIDPGTVATATLTEKAVTLAVALQLRQLLAQGGRYDVHMTRQGDSFVALDQRVRFSRQHGADLFISIHADALAEVALAQAVRGATVYVLADRASDEAARRLADKENAADVLAGLAAVPTSVENQVRSILLDLVQRETANFSATFRNLLVGTMRGKVPLAKDPHRSAAFKVLKQPETPSVLVELGYMSNAEDLARLTRPDGQRTLAASIAAAVDSFFAKRDAKAGR